METNNFVELKKSQLNGLGIYAKENIKEGTLWYPHDENTNIIITPEQYYILCNSKNKEYNDFYNSINNFGYYSEIHGIVYILNEARFVNHSYTPNSIILKNGGSIAKIDIKKGDEILEDYTTYGNCPFTKLCEKFLYSNILNKTYNYKVKNKQPMVISIKQLNNKNIPKEIKIMIKKYSKIDNDKYILLTEELNILPEVLKFKI
jgi:hypothetical protein